MGKEQKAVQNGFLHNQGNSIYSVVYAPKQYFSFQKSLKMTGLVSVQRNRMKEWEVKDFCYCRKPIGLKGDDNAEQ